MTKKTMNKEVDYDSCLHVVRVLDIELKPTSSRMKHDKKAIEARSDELLAEEYTPSEAILMARAEWLWNWFLHFGE